MSDKRSILNMVTTLEQFAGDRPANVGAGSLHGMVVQRLGFMIASGQFKAGDVLPSSEQLCERLGVGRSVLREGLKVLSGKGMIEARPKTGTRVRPRADWNHLDPDLLTWRFSSPSFRDVADIFDLRRAIEPAAASLCARGASDGQIAELEAALAEMAMTADDSMAFAVPDLKFHQLLLRCTGNELIAALASVVDMALLISFKLSDDRTSGQHHALPLHKAVVERIADRDEEGARLKMVELLDEAEADVRRVLERRSSGSSRKDQ